LRSAFAKGKGGFSVYHNVLQNDDSGFEYIMMTDPEYMHKD
jgi:hypothetical protein